MKLKIRWQIIPIILAFVIFIYTTFVKDMPINILLITIASIIFFVTSTQKTSFKHIDNFPKELNKLACSLGLLLSMVSLLSPQPIFTEVFWVFPVVVSSYVIIGAYFLFYGLLDDVFIGGLVVFIVGLVGVIIRADELLKLFPSHMFNLVLVLGAFNLGYRIAFAFDPNIKHRFLSMLPVAFVLLATSIIVSVNEPVYLSILFLGTFTFLVYPYNDKIDNSFFQKDQSDQFRGRFASSMGLLLWTTLLFSLSKENNGTLSGDTFIFLSTGTGIVAHSFSYGFGNLVINNNIEFDKSSMFLLVTAIVLLYISPITPISVITIFLSSIVFYTLTYLQLKIEDRFKKFQVKTTILLGLLLTSISTLSGVQSRLPESLLTPFGIVITSFLGIYGLIYLVVEEKDHTSNDDKT